MREGILAIDQGTTATKVVLVDRAGRRLAAASRPVPISYPRPGWVEQDAEEIWRGVADACAEVGASGARILGVVLTNQRETAVAWRPGGAPVAPALGWQDRRTEGGAAALRAREAAGYLRDVTGLDPSPMFTAPKLAWLRDAGAAGARSGTVDAWLIDRLTGGATYATEAGNASRTLLLDLATGTWDEGACSLFGLAPGDLPQVRRSDGPWGEVRGLPGVPDGTPLLAVLGDSHAALYGHRALAPDAGDLPKATYGTGSSIMAGAPDVATRRPGLSTSLAWRLQASVPALEGNILAAGAALDWLARILGLDVSALFDLAADGAGGQAHFVPALTGLGAPWWDPAAPGLIVGLSADTSRADLARAGVEAVAHQVCDVVDALDLPGGIAGLHVGGGLTRADLMLRVQADLLGRPLLATPVADISALGVAALAWHALGSPLEPAPDLRPRTVDPDPRSDATRAERRARWRDALGRSLTAPAPTHPTKENRP